MNIGFLSDAFPFLPSRDGFRLYGANLLRCLSRSHEIDLVAFVSPGDQLEWPEKYCRSVRHIRATPGSVWKQAASLAAGFLRGTPLRCRLEMRNALRQGIAAGQWDVLHVEGDYSAGILPSDLPVPKVLSLHDSLTLRYAELARGSQDPWTKFRYGMLKFYKSRYARLVFPRFDACLLVSERDSQSVSALVPGLSTFVIPNGVDTDYFHPMAQPPEAESTELLFHGNLSYAPNIEAAMHFANTVLPQIRGQIPSAVFHLAGAAPAAPIRKLASRPEVRLSADVPDIRTALSQAALYVCPVLRGTGVKNKLLEAMAMQLPIVTYSAAVESTLCEDGRDLLVARDTSDFAAKALELLRDRERSRQLGAAGRRLVEEHYSWESRAESLTTLYEQLASSRLASQSHAAQARP